jgi:hypothetical protein
MEEIVPSAAVLSAPDPRRDYKDGLTVPAPTLGLRWRLLCLVRRHPWGPWERYYLVQYDIPLPVRSTRACRACGKVEDTGRAA